MLLLTSTHVSVRARARAHARTHTLVTVLYFYLFYFISFYFRDGINPVNPPPPAKHGERECPRQSEDSVKAKQWKNRVHYSALRPAHREKDIHWLNVSVFYVQSIYVLSKMLFLKAKVKDLC